MKLRPEKVDAKSVGSESELWMSLTALVVVETVQVCIVHGWADVGMTAVAAVSLGYERENAAHPQGRDAAMGEEMYQP